MEQLCRNCHTRALGLAIGPFCRVCGAADVVTMAVCTPGISYQAPRTRFTPRQGGVRRVLAEQEAARVAVLDDDGEVD